MVTSSFASLNVVYPACAGIDPIEVIDSKLEYGLPRMRGSTDTAMSPRPSS